MRRLSLWTAVVVLCGSAPVALSQDRVYRCGPDGRAYSHEPCADGQSIGVGDARSAQQVAQARQVVLREGRVADALERQRLQIEGLATRQGPVLIGPSVRWTSLDEKRCAKGAQCGRSEPSQRRHDKTQAVTLYRAAGTR